MVIPSNHETARLRAACLNCTLIRGCVTTYRRIDLVTNAIWPGRRPVTISPGEALASRWRLDGNRLGLAVGVADSKVLAGFRSLACWQVSEPGFLMRDGQGWRYALHQVLRCLPNDFTASGRALGEYLNLPGLADVLACQLIGLALGSGHVFVGRGPFGLRLRPAESPHA